MSRMNGSEEPEWYEETKGKNPIWRIVNFCLITYGGALTIKWIAGFLF